MALPTSGAISASMINTELGRSASAAFSMNGTAERSLAGVASGAIAFKNFYGKALWDGGRELVWTAGSSQGSSANVSSGISIYGQGFVIGSYSRSTSGGGTEIGRWTPSSTQDATECRWVRTSGATGSAITGTAEGVWVMLSNGSLSVTVKEATLGMRIEFRRGSLSLGSVNFTLYA